MADKQIAIIGGHHIGGLLAKEFDVTGMSLPKGEAVSMQTHLSPKKTLTGLEIMNMVHDMDEGIKKLQESRKQLLALFD